MQASFSYTRTDAARFAGLDSSLRLALNGGLQERLDQQAIEGTDGLLTGTNLPNNNVNTVSTFALYLSGLLYGRVDGRYARTPGDIRMIVGQGTFAHASAAFKGNNSDESGVERLQEKSGGLMVSAFTPDVASNKQNALIRLGMERGAAVQPMWQGVSLVVDEFTRAASGRSSSMQSCSPTSPSPVRRSGTNSRRNTPRPMETLHCPVEIREADNGPMLHGVLIQEGRVASVRPEVFSPGSLVWSSDGVAIRAKHLGAEDSRAIPTREAGGEIRIAAPASAALVAAFNEGRKFLSIEFHALQETLNKAGVREIQQAFIPGVALVESPEYVQATAEVRSKQRRVWL